MINRASVGLASLVLAGVLAGCGDDGDGSDSGGNDFADQGSDEIREAALEAMASLDSLHFSLNVSRQAQSTSVELSMSADGSCTGTLAAGATTAQVLRTADGGWYKPNLALLEQDYPGKGKKVAEYVGDAWVKDTGPTLTEANCDIGNLVDSLSDDFVASDGTAPRVEGDVVRLDFSGEGIGSAYVLAEGEHYLVRIVREGSFAVFSEFNEPVDTKPPAPGDVVDLADFPG